ncbi:hypothetical protein TNCV_3633531 [Trichonephila clavipes]|nr:hypothetical protein TNCV_3633531 [Trichonephila clavipes]
MIKSLYTTGLKRHQNSNSLNRGTKPNAATTQNRKPVPREIALCQLLCEKGRDFSYADTKLTEKGVPQQNSKISLPWLIPKKLKKAFSFLNTQKAACEERSFYGIILIESSSVEEKVFGNFFQQLVSVDYMVKRTRRDFYSKLSPNGLLLLLRAAQVDVWKGANKAAAIHDILWALPL